MTMLYLCFLALGALTPPPHCEIVKVVTTRAYLKHDLATWTVTLHDDPVKVLMRCDPLIIMPDTRCQEAEEEEGGDAS